MAELSKDIVKLIREEIEKSAVRKAVEEAASPVGWRDVLRHPLMLTVVAFFLTAVVGVVVERYLNKATVMRAEARQELAEANALEEERLATVDELAELIARRWAASTLLRSSLKRDDRGETRRHLLNYEEVFFDWNHLKSSYDARVREIVTADDQMFTDKNTVFEMALIRGIDVHFTSLHSCLTAIRAEALDIDIEERNDFVHPNCNHPDYKPTNTWKTVSWARLLSVDACKTQVIRYLRHKIREDKLIKLGSLDKPQKRDDAAWARFKVICYVD